MAKKESTFTSMVLTLFLVTLGASAALGYVYQLTKPDIDKAESAKKSLAIQRVVPEFDNVPGDEFFKVPAESAGDTLIFYVAKNGADTVGFAIESFSKNAFGGLLRLLVGLNPDGTINNIAVLEHKETPGLGTKMTQEKFASQFPGKNPEEFNLKVTKDGGQIDAITASTITSRAYCEAVQRAFEAYKTNLKGGLQ